MTRSTDGAGHGRHRWRLRRPTGRRSVATIAATGLMLSVAGVAAAALATYQHAGPQGDGTGYTSYGWHITPVGDRTNLGERPYGMALSPDGRTILVSNAGVHDQSVMAVDAASGRVLQKLHYPAPQAVFLGVTFAPDGSRAYVSGGPNNLIRVYRVADQRLHELAPLQLRASAKSSPFPAGLTVSKDGRRLYVADNLGNAMSVVNVTTGAERRAILNPATCPVTQYYFDPSQGRACNFPYTVVLSADDSTAYVSNWGKRSVAVVDTASLRLKGNIEVGTHPSAMTRNPTNNELYVANTDSDTVSVVDTATNRVTRTISVEPYANAGVGSSPNALEVAPDGKTLYVANAGDNDIAVVRLGGGGRADAVQGLIPTGWYPTGVAVSHSGNRLYMMSAKGLGAGPNPRGPNPNRDRETPPNQYIGSMIKGMLTTLPVPSAERLADLTRRVEVNNGFTERGSVRVVGNPNQSVVPYHVGGSSPIKHVIYIINENRTYDQVLGDLGQGNGDPSLTLFGPRVTPNHHKLSNQFTTLDNLYAAGEVSNDGWEWSTAANANTLNQKTWPTLYGGRGYFYTAEGGTLAAAPGKDPTNSYIWDRLSQQGISFRNYGLWATPTPPVTVYNEPNLYANTDVSYPGFNMAIPDQVRYREWEREFRQYEKAGNLPTVQFMKFPRDHTCGTSPDCPSPKAMVADSDWATGKVVDAVSHSKFWKDTAIFIIEDDAQDGPDHVDAHRTVGHVVSPYTQLNGKVDSTFYSTMSFLRTMELILGLRPMTQFDAAATPLFNSFTDNADFAAYNAEKPEQSLTEPNLPSAPMAAQSSRMNFTVEDQAPQRELNEAIWQSVRGAGSKMPGPRGATEEDDEG